MAVVVQRMVDAEVAGVLFTADPLTGSRSASVVDAAPGLGTAVVDGTEAADHYVLDGTQDGERGCLTPARLKELRAAGERIKDLLGAEQDIEWAYDRDGELWLLQARPITTLFPAPPPSERPGPRLYVEFGHVQGMLQPATPMGMSTLKSMLAGMLAAFGLTVEIVDVGGRLYGDLTDALRDPSTRQRLVKLMAVDFGPRAQKVVEHLLDDSRFAPQKTPRKRNAAAMRTGPKVVAGILGALARPARARARVFGEIERLRRQPVTDPATAAELLDLVERDAESSTRVDAIIWPVVSGLAVSAALPSLLKGIASEDEIRTVLGGMPYNVTIEMDLELWEVARNAEPYREMLLATPPAELAAAQLAGTLQDFGLDAFLKRYGTRSAAEVDVGVPRWAEDPTPVFTMLANCPRVTDPEQAPDRRFARAADRAESMLSELAQRARRKHALRGRLAGFFLRRSRELAGLREAGKFAGLYALRDRRRRLLVIDTELVSTSASASAGHSWRSACGSPQHPRRQPLFPSADRHGVGLGRDGGMAEYALVPSGRHLMPIGDLPADQAAPLSDAVLIWHHAVAGVRHALGDGATAAVIGVGGLGHLAVQILRATTPSRVLAVDIREEALALARRSGAHAGALMRADTGRVPRTRTRGVGVDAVLDFVGNKATLELAADVLRPGGELAVVGSGGGS